MYHNLDLERFFNKNQIEMTRYVASYIASYLIDYTVQIQFLGFIQTDKLHLFWLLQKASPNIFFLLTILDSTVATAGGAFVQQVLFWLTTKARSIFS